MDFSLSSSFAALNAFFFLLISTYIDHCIRMAAVCVVFFFSLHCTYCFVLMLLLRNVGPTSFNRPYCEDCDSHEINNEYLPVESSTNTNTTKYWIGEPNKAIKLKAKQNRKVCILLTRISCITSTLSAYKCLYGYLYNITELTCTRIIIYIIKWYNDDGDQDAHFMKGNVPRWWWRRKKRRRQRNKKTKTTTANR